MHNSLTIPTNAPTLLTFTYAQGVDIRLLIEGGKPLFVAFDVCTALGYANVTQTLQTHVAPAECRTVSLGAAARGNAPRLVLTVAGLRTLLIRSRKPVAAPLRKWIGGVVLPSLKPAAPAVTPVASGYAAMDFKQLTAHIHGLQAKAAETIAAEAVKQWAACR